MKLTERAEWKARIERALSELKDSTEVVARRDEATRSRETRPDAATSK